MCSKAICVNDRARDLAAKAKGAILGIYTAMMLAPYSVSCTGFLNGTATVISVSTSISATTIVNRLITLIAGIFVIVGIFKVGTSAFSILEAYSEDNSAAMNKAVKQLGIGAVFIGAPVLMLWLLG